MASVLSWLDFSEMDQRRAREIIQLFLQPESRDELGIGTVRDAISDTLFPGVSVIQTRARYFLFIPWLYMEGVRRNRRGRVLVDWVENWERRQVEILRKSGAVEGLIGRLAGAAVKILPSTIYWNGLQRFNILKVAGSQEVVAGVQPKPQQFEEALTERVSRTAGAWDEAIPPPPNGFPDVQELTFALGEDEAQWLSERIQQTAAGTALAWLASQGRALEPDSSGPWDEPLLTRSSRAIRDQVRHAEIFSLVMHGASLLYNLLLTRRCKELKLNELAKYEEKYEEELQGWAREITDRRRELEEWDRLAFWDIVSKQNARVSWLTRSFIDHWCDFAIEGQPNGVAHDGRVIALVTNREKAQKKAQSRLTNERLLKQWGGASGTGRLAFRWDRVKVLVNDVAEGLHAGA